MKSISCSAISCWQSWIELKTSPTAIGVEIDETLAAQYPYDPAYLPVNRKLDGTLHSW